MEKPETATDTKTEKSTYKWPNAPLFFDLPVLYN